LLATEFVIVTLGVALALAADSAVDRYRERSLANEALVAVQRDLEEDIDQLDVRIPRLDSMGIFQDYLTTYVGGEFEVQDSVGFLRALSRVTLYLTFDANTAAVEGLRSNGRLDLVAGDELRSALLEYVNEVENVAEMDVQQRAVALANRARLTPILINGTSWPVVFLEDDRENRRRAATALNGVAMRDSDALRELLLVAEQLLWWQSLRYRALREDAQRLADLLSAAIGSG
jgi:hypothetical protein